MGSLVSPADRAALYTMRPTPKIIGQEGIIPVSHTADSAGPMCKSALDIANLLDVLVDASKTNIPEGGYKSVVTGLWGDIRIGVIDPEKMPVPPYLVGPQKEVTDQIVGHRFVSPINLLIPFAVLRMPCCF
jgi:amidase